jgi:hypothetical protein
MTPEQIAVQKTVELGQGTRAMRLWSAGLISWEELQSGRFDDVASERRVITVRDAAEARAEIASASVDDSEMAACIARNLMLDVLFTVARGASNARELAEAALLAHREVARR